MIELTNEQKRLKSMIRNWFLHKEKPYFSYSGGAGCGKTTVIRSFIEDMGLKPNEVICSAYTGKATLVLLNNGLNACTIHSLIYDVVFVPVLDDAKNPILNKNGNLKMKMEFQLKEKLENSSLKLIVIDEASMVNDELCKDIMSFGIPVIFIGDNNQLPPVFGTSSVMLHPDFTLTKIMRQAEGNPIIYLSQLILNNSYYKIGNYGDSRVMTNIPINMDLINNYDIIIVGKNKTRDAINDVIRYQLLNRKDLNPVIGDKVVCCQNDKTQVMDNMYLTNGTVGYITDIDMSKTTKSRMVIDFRPDYTRKEFRDVEIDYNYIKLGFKDRKEIGMTKYTKFEYGYAITCHKCQGSQYNRVLFIDEPFHKDGIKQFRYTAITRAIDRIDIIRCDDFVKRLARLEW